MRLVRSGYEESKNETRFEIEDKDESKVDAMVDEMNRQGHKGGAGSDLDDYFSALFIVDTFNVEDFKYSYKLAKQSLR